MSRATPGYRTPPLSASEREKLIEEFLPLVHHILGRLPLRLPVTLDREDLFEVGVLGLINAADTYDAGRGAAFKTHAYTNVRGAILDEIRRHDVVPRSRRDRMRLLGRAEETLAERLHRPATLDELAEETELTVTQVEDALTHAHGAIVLSMEESASGGDEGATRLIDCLQMPGATDPSDEAATRELKAALAVAIQELPERERHVIILYYAEGLLLKEIGGVLDVTESRVCQLHARAIRRLNLALQGAPKAES